MRGVREHDRITRQEISVWVVLQEWNYFGRNFGCILQRLNSITWGWNKRKDKKYWLFFTWYLRETWRNSFKVCDGNSSQNFYLKGREFLSSNLGVWIIFEKQIEKRKI